MPDSSFSVGRSLRILVPLALAGFGGWYLVRSSGTRPLAVPSTAAKTLPVESRGPVGALGHFRPAHGLLRIAAPYYESRPSVVARLAVAEGQTVQRGQLIALLDGKPQLEAARLRALAQVDLARRRLEQVRAGTKPSDHEAQRAEIQRLEAAHRLDELQLARSERLFASQDISAATLDARRAAEQTSRRAIDAARQRLSSLMEVRAEDVRVAESELAVAQAVLPEIESRLAALTVTAPAAGVVVKIHARAGEQPGPEGILEMADVRQMEVEAEVYASDLATVHLGQHAVIEPEGSAATLVGEVIRLGSEVRAATVLSGDPVSFNDARVVPVRLAVAACATSPCPINGRVRLRFDAPGTSR